MSRRTLQVAIAVGFAFAIMAVAYVSFMAFVFNKKYDGWIEDDVNRALNTRLTYSDTRGLYIASMPDTARLTYTDVILEVDSAAFQVLLRDADFPEAWDPFMGSNPLGLSVSAELTPWWREEDIVLGRLGWGEINGGYRRVVDSGENTFVFLLVLERRWLRYRRYPQEAA